MILRICRDCEHHEVQWDENEKMGHCSKENMWSIYTKCISNLALAEFIERERVRDEAEQDRKGR